MEKVAAGIVPVNGAVLVNLQRMQYCLTYTDGHWGLRA